MNTLLTALSFRYKPQEVLIQEEVEITKDKRDGSVKRSSLYSNISSSTLNEIKNIDLDGSFGTKIDMRESPVVIVESGNAISHVNAIVARHILWIRHNDPGAKSVVFSQYQDFLRVLARAFSHFKIAAIDIDSKGGIQTFQKEAGVSKYIIQKPTQCHYYQLTTITDGGIPPARQSAIIRSQSSQRHARLPLRTTNQHGNRTASHRTSPPNRPTPSNDSMDASRQRHRRREHLRHLVITTNGAYPKSGYGRRRHRRTDDQQHRRRRRNDRRPRRRRRRQLPGTTNLFGFVQTR